MSKKVIEHIEWVVYWLSIVILMLLIVWLRFRPTPELPLDKQLESIQNYYNIPYEARVTVDHVFHVDDRDDVYAYYKLGNVYLCDKKLDECTYEQKLYALAHELSHHQQKLALGDRFKSEYNLDPEKFEDEASKQAKKYMKEVWGVDFGS